MYLAELGKRYRKYQEWLQVVRISQQLNLDALIKDRFEDFLRTKRLTEATKDLYRKGLEFILKSDDDTVLTSCVYSQNTRTVLKYLAKMLRKE